MVDATLVQCYNKGCGQKFDPAENKEGTCEHHPGQPVFHDAEKYWSCCNKRSKDFTVFLGMPGCIKGLHNATKPAEAPKPAPVPTPSPLKPEEESKRPSFDAALVTLEPTITSSLTQLLKKAAEAATDTEKIIDPTTGIAIGEPCKRNGCKTNYECASTNLELCQYHSGGPVFHEGLKFWSCCKKKTTDFSEFLAQLGCTTDKHLWIDDKSSSRKTVCRYDWHQTGSHTFITIYAKGTIPDKSKVSVNAVRVCATIVHGQNLQFDLDIELKGIVDPSQSSLTFAGTKVEIKLKKADFTSWSSLNVVKLVKEEKEVIDKPCDVDDLDVDAVDLSDL